MNSKLHPSETVNSSALRAFLGLEHGEAHWLDDEDSTEPLIPQSAVRYRNDPGPPNEEFQLLDYPGDSSPQTLKPPFEKKHNPRLSGWRAGVLSCSLTAFGVLLVNIILMIWAIAKHGLDAGYGILYAGNCGQARTISTALHILINILSTVLLSASNYTMQCLHSPTRAQIDKAHSQKQWLDIGIPSWRNRNHVSVRNRVLWWLLGLSSIPLHFIYNSSVFLDIAAQEYHASFTNKTLSQLLLDNTLPGPETNYISMAWDACERTYNRTFIFAYGDLFSVTPDTLIIENLNLTGFENSTTSLYNTTFFTLEGRPILWIVNKTLSNLRVSLNDGDSFNGSAYLNVTSCYSKTAVEHCKLKFNISIIAVVILCNFSKAVCMLLTYWNSREFPLVTVGDAVSSFLEDPDPTTKNMCLYSKHYIENIWDTSHIPRTWNPAEEQGYYSVLPRRWTIVNLLYFFTFLALILGLALGIQPSISDFSTGIGFGSSLNKTPTVFSIGSNMSNFQTILVVNTPQVLVSLMNVLYNGILTALMLVSEWNSFSERHQPLRVTVPSGEQKSKYYLSIPYRYAVPFLVLTGTFHWLISDSFFLVRITAYKDLDIQPDDSVFGIGYSALAIVLASVTCFLLLALLGFKSMQRFKPGMPMVGSCSAAISAACHKAESDGMPQVKKVMWGVVQGRGDNMGAWTNGKDVGHCAFSSELVSPPIPGRLYAGR